ncbi:MAG TPA: hypothetical protein VI792_02845, partial [Candidatus Eisenbacteria bacterium]
PASRAPLLPAPAVLLDPRAPFLLPLVMLVISRVLFAVILPLASEDAYITYRYALNLTMGNGLVYNPGERVMGFSSPLWTVWSAIGIALLHDPVVWSRAWALVADVVTLLVVTGAIDRRHGRASAWCFAFFFAGWNYFAAVSSSGMEMSAMLALMALGAVLAERGSRLAGPALGLLALVRPEGLVAAAVLALGAGRRDRIVAGVIAAAGLLGLQLYFHTLVPQSVVAKAGLYGTPGPWAGRLWWEWLSPFPLGTWGITSEGQIVSRLAVVLGPAAVVGAMALWRDRSSPVARLALAASAVWLGYALLGVSYFFWYLIVPLAAAILLAAIGIPRIVKGPAVYAGAALFVLGAWLIAPALYIDRARGEARSFYDAARDLAAAARPGQRIMLEPIGLIGYLCPLVVTDETGLVSPRVAQRRQEGPGWLADLVASERPDWLLMRRGEMSDSVAFAGRGLPFRSAAERDSMLARYQVAAWENPDAGSLALALLRRVR